MTRVPNAAVALGVDLMDAADQRDLSAGRNGVQSIGLQD